MKPPLSYYGGKQRLASKIVPYIHEIPHTVYVEPFCGGATVLFEKGYPSVTNSHHYREVVNDLNQELVTFYRVAKENPEALDRKIQATLHSRADYKKAVSIVKNSSNFSDLDIAWAVWVGFNQSFAHNLTSWACQTQGENTSATVTNKKTRLPEQLKRLEQTYIECDDALNIIKRWDSPNTLFYCDPPYINTNLGHYDGYAESDYKNLLEALSSIEGSFILSGYPNDLTPKEWRYVDFTAQMSAANGRHREKLDTTRIERIWIKDNSKDESVPLSFEVNKQESLFNVN